MFYVAGLLFHAVQLGFFAKDLLDGFNQLGERDRAVVTEVDEFVVGLIVVQGTDDAVDGVGDVGVIATGGAVAKDRDRLSGFNQADKFVDREVGPLARAVNGEETEADEADAVEMTVNVAEKFAADFTAGVGADGLQDGVGFGPGYVGIDTVHRRRRPKYKLLDALILGEFQKVLRGRNVRPLVAKRI